MFYHKVERIVIDLEPFSLDEFKLQIINEKPESLWNYQWSKTIPLYKLHEITDEYVWISCHSWGDETPKKWTWERLYRELMISGLTNIFTKAHI